MSRHRRAKGEVCDLVIMKSTKKLVLCSGSEQCLKDGLVSFQVFNGCKQYLEDSFKSSHMCGGALEQNAGGSPHGKAAIADLLGS